MTRPTIRTCEVRARDLIPGDIVAHAHSRTPVWLIVESVEPNQFKDGLVNVRYKGGTGEAIQAVGLVTIQKEVG